MTGKSASSCTAVKFRIAAIDNLLEQQFETMLVKRNAFLFAICDNLENLLCFIRAKVSFLTASREFRETFKNENEILPAFGICQCFGPGSSQFLSEVQCSLF